MARQVRCAIYTRKSTEEGLEQAFNSLDAQREACAAYIVSQRHEGWALVPELYDDGGFSGGTMERPALRQLLADVAAGRIDVIVVYKVDRLTRSLADFARIIEILDKAEASFVSVTQAFNTTSSMGRLTLNVLLSFAQFEREVTGARIRDKIAASKRKGMWMGGVVPLGYDVRDRNLIVNGAEAAQVCMMFRRYLDLGSIGDLAAELAERGVRSKQRQLKAGRIVGGVVFSKGAIAQILRNPLYRGLISHRGEHYPGQHDAIVDADLWQQVQDKLAANRVAQTLGTRARAPSLLAGMLFDQHRRPMTPSHAVKDGKRYRYYISRVKPGDAVAPLRLAAGEVEAMLVSSIIALLRDRSALANACNGDATALQGLIDWAAAQADLLDAAGQSERRRLLLALKLHATIGDDGIAIMLVTPAGSLEHSLQASPTRIRSALRLVLPADERTAGAPDAALIGLLVRAHQAHARLRAADTIGSKVEKDRLTRLARLVYLAPDITTAILEGRQPQRLSARVLLRIPALPLGWAEQKALLGFG